MEETTVRNGRKREGDGGNGNRILGDERKERLGGKEERKGGREGRLGNGSDGRKWWKAEKKWEQWKKGKRGWVVEEGKGERKVWNVGNENGRKK